MKAKCPHCKTGCDKCDNGYFDTHVAVGDWYTRHCKECKMDNGVRVATEFLPPQSEWPSPNPCVFCGSANMEWQKVETAI
jgi:hypothetical protein